MKLKMDLKELEDYLGITDNENYMYIVGTELG